MVLKTSIKNDGWYDNTAGALNHVTKDILENGYDQRFFHQQNNVSGKDDANGSEILIVDWLPSDKKRYKTRGSDHCRSDEQLHLTLLLVNKVTSSDTWNFDS